jgi:hypothetical protein
VDCTASCIMTSEGIINWKGCERRRPEPTSRYSGMFMKKRMRIITKNLGQRGRSPSRDMNPGVPECEAGALSSQLRPSAAAVVGVLIT